VRFNRPEMTKLFYNSRRFGFYLKVIREGSLQAGNPISIVHRDENAVSVAQLIALYTGDNPDADVLRRVIAVEALPEAWRQNLQERAKQRNAAASR
jgi:MOSC domain-containing protein YiiM